jgi:hypothetical protein
MRLFLNKGHTPEPAATPDQVTIRRAYPDDAAALVRLAALDCRRLPTGELLVAEVAGQLWAAVSISSNLAIADPFRPSAGLVRLLRVRAAQLDVAARAAGRDSARLKNPVTALRQPTG